MYNFAFYKLHAVLSSFMYFPFIYKRKLKTDEI